MTEFIKRNPHWIALLGTILTLLLAIITSATAFGGLSKQVYVNTDNISVLQNDVKVVPSRAEIVKMQGDITDIRNYLLGEKGEKKN